MPSLPQPVPAAQLVLSSQLMQGLKAGAGKAPTLDLEVPPASHFYRRPPAMARAWCRSF